MFKNMTRAIESMTNFCWCLFFMLSTEILVLIIFDSLNIGFLNYYKLCYVQKKLVLIHSKTR